MTMTDLPAPLTPADCDLRGLEYMPLLGQHLFGSEFNARADDSEWRAGITLWWAAWCQVPAASLPDDDIALCRFADLGRDVKLWKKLRANALHGWVKCADGRLYHPTLAKQALLAWDKRRANKEDRSVAAERKAREREARSRLFAQLAAVGVTPEWNIKTSDLRDLVTLHCSDNGQSSHTPVTQNVTPPVTPVTLPVTSNVTAKTGRDGTGRITVPSGTGGADENLTGNKPPPEPPSSGSQGEDDPNRIIWANGVALLGETARPQIARWIKTHGPEIVGEAFDRALAAKPERPAGYIQSILTRLGQEARQRAEEQAQAEALFDARYPPRELSEFEARALMPPEDFQRWQARQFGIQA